MFLFILGDSGVWGLKKNFALLELLERLQNGHIGQYGAAEEAIGISGEVLMELSEILTVNEFFFELKMFAFIKP